MYLRGIDVEEATYKERHSVVQYDDCGGGNPRENDCVGTIYYTSYKYKLGDERISAERLKEIVDDEENICVPVYAYIHSGVTVSTRSFNDRWDSGQCGFIVCSKEDAKREFCRDSDAKPDEYVERAIKCVESEIQRYDLWIRGQVYWYKITTPEGLEVDSCGGILTGDVKEVMSMIKEEIDYFEEKREHLGGIVSGGHYSRVGFIPTVAPAP